MVASALPEAPFSFTHKSGKGYDATMVTIRGGTAEEFYSNGQAIFGEMWDDLIVNHMHVPQDAQPGSPPAQAGGNAPAGGGGDWKAQAPQCAHGQREARAFTPKSGPNANKEQYAYFCPQPREAADKCKPVDALTGKEWGSK